MTNHLIEIHTEKCIGCGLCANVCPARNIELKNGKANVLSDDCIKCGHCSAVCPKEAVTISGYEEEASPKKENMRLNPETVLEVIRFRRSIRQFQDKEIPKAVLDQILEAGRLTHTAKNMQDVSFTVLDKEKASIERMAVKLFKRIKPFAGIFNPSARRMNINDDFFFFKAPAVIIIMAKDKTNGILAAQNMEFVAEANGLGVLFSGFFAFAANFSKKIGKALRTPKGKKVAAVLVLGYPKTQFLRSTQREKLKVEYL